MHNLLLAAASSYSSYDSASSAALSTFFGLYTGISILMICLYIVAIAYSVFGLVISTLSLIDIANRTKEEVPDKTMWVLLIYPFGTSMLFIPAMIYYFSKRKKFK